MARTKKNSIVRAKKYDLRHIEEPDNRSGIEFEKLRFEYAWRHFDMHAKQRIQMFYFFLISIAFLCGILANLANTQRPELASLPSLIAIVGLTISFVFLALDVRNRELYSISRRHLKALEKNVLYPDGFREIYEHPETRSRRVVGIMIEDAIGQFWLFRHKFLIPLCHVGSAGLFFYLLLRLNKWI